MTEGRASFWYHKAKRHLLGIEEQENKSVGPCYRLGAECPWMAHVLKA
jgi:hypothetical protein